MAEEPIRKVLSRLEGKKPRGGIENAWLALCPAHNDKNQSLAVEVRPNGAVNLHCYAGCLKPSILAKLGLEMKDLFRGGREPHGEAPKNSGITLGRLEHFKRIPVAFMKSQGLYDAKDGSVPVVKIPYRDVNGTILFERQREGPTGRENMQPKGVPLALYGQWHIPEFRKAGRIIFVEGECLPGDAEVFTTDGWMRLDKYDGKPVAVWDESCEMKFESPSRYIKREGDGELVRLSNQRGYTTTVTAKHRIPRVFDDRVSFVEAGEFQKSYHTIPRCGVIDGPGVGVSGDLIQLVIATSADAAIHERKSSGAYLFFNFLKQRKIDRLCGILDRLKLAYKMTPGNRPGHSYIKVVLPNHLAWVGKRLLPREWLVTASLAEREFILEEMVHWDGNRVRNRTQTEFASKIRENADWMQTMAHTSGRCSTVMTRKNRWGTWFKVSVLNNKTSTSCQKLEKEIVPHAGDVYCLTVSTGMFLVRQDGCVSVTGNSDTLTLWMHGYPALGIPGASAVGCFDESLLDEFAEVYVWQESDNAGSNMIQALTKKFGARPWKVINSPDAKDPNELYAKDPEKFKERFDACLAAATAPGGAGEGDVRGEGSSDGDSAVPTTPDGPNDGPGNPHRLAEIFLADISPADSPLLLRFWRSEFHRYRDGAYRAVPNDDLRGEVTERARAELIRANAIELAAWRAEGSKGNPPKVRPVTSSLINDVLNAMKGRCLLPASTDAPAWINGATGPDPAGLLPLSNGILDLDAFAADRVGCLLPPSPSFFTPTAAPFAFDPHVPPPVEWLKFLQKVWPDDPESIEALREWLGYLLTPDTRQHKILLLIGPPRSGKGTFARVLSALVGPANVAGPTLSSLSTNFGLSQLLGKSVAIISDARLSGRSDSAVTTERLLSISGEDTLTVDRKHRESLTVKLNTRFVIMSNELPRLGDASGALASRFILLRMTRSWLGKENYELFQRLRGELLGILLWAVEGWRRLRDRGRFLQPKSAGTLAEEMGDLSSPISAFVRDRCFVAAGERVEVCELYREWRAWCDAHGRNEPGTEATFGRDLRAAVSSLEKTRPRTSGGRLHFYIGIRIRRDSDPDPDADSPPDGHPGHSGHSDQVLNAMEKVELEESQGAIRDRGNKSSESAGDHGDHCDQGDRSRPRLDAPLPDLDD